MRAKTSCFVFTCAVQHTSSYPLDMTAAQLVQLLTASKPLMNSLPKAAAVQRRPAEASS